MCCYLVTQRKGKKRKTREQHANHNIPAEILTSELYSLKPDLYRGKFVFRMEQMFQKIQWKKPQ